MKRLIIIFLLVMVDNAFGQSTDILYWESDTLSLYSNPLELKSDWKKINQMISDKVEELRDIEPKDKEVEINIGGNYYTEWTIENDSLFLLKISSSYDINKNIELDNLLFQNSERYFADWVNSPIILHSGECIICEACIYKDYSVYLNEKLVEFENGIVSNSSDFVNRIVKESNFFSSNPNIFADFIYGNIKWNKLPDLGNKHLQVWVSVEPSSDGNLKKIDWENTYLFDGSNLITDAENAFIDEATRIVRLIPDWNVIIRQNKILNQSILIVFDKHKKEKYAR